MHKPSCQNFFHAGIIIWPGNRLYFKFPIIAPLGLSLFVDHHRPHIGKTADIGNIEGFHAVNIFQSEQPGYFPNRSYGTPFFSLNALLVLA